MLHVYCPSFSSLLSVQTNSEVITRTAVDLWDPIPNSCIFVIYGCYLICLMSAAERVQSNQVMLMSHKNYLTSTSSWKIQVSLPSGEFPFPSEIIKVTFAVLNHNQYKSQRYILFHDCETITICSQPVEENTFQSQVNNPLVQTIFF